MTLEQLKSEGFETVRCELLVFFCESAKGQGHQGIHKTEYTAETPKTEDLKHAEYEFNTWSNCYMVKIRRYDESGMFSDQVISKRNIEL